MRASREDAGADPIRQQVRGKSHYSVRRRRHDPDEILLPTAEKFAAGLLARVPDRCGEGVGDQRFYVAPGESA